VGCFPLFDVFLRRTGCQSLWSPAGIPQIRNVPSILSLRGGIESVEVPLDAEFSLGEVDPSSSAGKSKCIGFVDHHPTSAQRCDDSEALFPEYDCDKEIEARIIDCKFSHVGDKNGVIYYLGESMPSDLDLISRGET
jgi:hypothetical protein